MFVGMQVGSPQTPRFGDTDFSSEGECRLQNSVITPAPLLIAGFISEFYAQEEVIVHSVARVRNISK